MMTRLLHLGRDERGASLIELALVAPFLASLLIGMVDLSRAYSEKLQLEQAAYRAIEKSMQGAQGDDSTDLFETLVTEAAEAADVEDDDVEVKYWLECNGVSQNTDPATMEADYGRVCTAGQLYARYVSVSVEKVYTPTFRMDWPGANPDGTFTLSGSAWVRVQ